MKEKICKYVLGFYRSADLEGVFIMNDEELASLKEIEGTEVHYGEVAGKHSDVNCVFSFADIEVVSDKEEDVAFFKRLFPEGVGYNHKCRWFNTDYAADEGWEAGYDYKGYNGDVKAALEEYKKYDNGVMREAFVDGFNRGMASRKEKEKGAV